MSTQKKVDSKNDVGRAENELPKVSQRGSSKSAVGLVI